MSESVRDVLARLACRRTGARRATAARWIDGGGASISARSPIDGSTLAEFAGRDASAQVDEAASRAADAFRRLALECRRRSAASSSARIGERLREHKADLGDARSSKPERSRQEALGEVQEMIDICDFAVGLSRQLYGKTIASERPGHRLMEQWHPLGPVGVITAFNFPVAVWAWNAMLGLGVRRPDRLEAVGKDAALRDRLSDDRAAGDCRDWRTCRRRSPASSSAAATSARRWRPRHACRSFRRPARCRWAAPSPTSRSGWAVAARTRRQQRHDRRAVGRSRTGRARDRLRRRRHLRPALHDAAAADRPRVDCRRAAATDSSRVYERLPIGDPREDGVLVGPLIDEQRWTRDGSRARGGRGSKAARSRRRPRYGRRAGRRLLRAAGASSRSSRDAPIVQQETFAPILYVMRYRRPRRSDRDPQRRAAGPVVGDLHGRRSRGRAFCSPAGSDCGIANVNIGTSGAEIGGAFGGEKETGGGRESGSDAWKAYMRRATNTVNYSRDLPLAQGIRFDI